MSGKTYLRAWAVDGQVVCLMDHVGHFALTQSIWPWKGNFDKLAKLSDAADEKLIRMAGYWRGDSHFPRRRITNGFSGC